MTEPEFLIWIEEQKLLSNSTPMLLLLNGLYREALKLGTNNETKCGGGYKNSSSHRSTN
jgi:hypothetical protein